MARFLESISDKWIEFGSSIPVSDTIGIADDVVDAGKALKKAEELNASGLYRTLNDSKSLGVGKKFTSAQKKKIIQVTWNEMAVS